MSNWDLSTFSLALPQIKDSFAIESEALFAAAVRSGAVLSIIITSLADMDVFGGRQGVFTAAVGGLALATLASSLAPSAPALLVAQVAARAFGTAETMLAVVLLIETTPRACRGFCLGVHMLAGAAGYGAGAAAYTALSPPGSGGVDGAAGRERSSAPGGGGSEGLVEGWRLCYGLASAVCAAVAVARWRCLEVPRRRHGETGPGSGGAGGAVNEADDGAGDGADDGAEAGRLLPGGRWGGGTRGEALKEASASAAPWGAEGSAGGQGARAGAAPGTKAPTGRPVWAAGLATVRVGAGGRRRLVVLCALYLPLAVGLGPATALVSTALQQDRGLSPRQVWRPCVKE